MSQMTGCSMMPAWLFKVLATCKAEGTEAQAVALTGLGPVSRTAPGRGGSSVGRARRSQCRGQGFDPPSLHQPSN